MFCHACGRPHAGECDKMVLLKNELNYVAQNGHLPTTVAALTWAHAEIERLRKVIEGAGVRLDQGQSQGIGQAFNSLTRLHKEPFVS